MFWSTFFLAIPALALAAAVWGILRRKWHGMLPLLVVSVAGWQADRFCWHPALRPFYETAYNPSLVSLGMTLLLTCGAAVMTLAALWAGWSRGWWFWRALVLVAVPASIVPMEANELIVICSISMPILAATAWLLRWRQDRLTRQEGSRARPRQVTLANAFLAFVIVGFLATSFRSVLVGHQLLVDANLFGLAASISGVALVACLPSIGRGREKKWLMVGTAALLVGWAYWRWRNWGDNPLGLATYFYHFRFPAIISAYQSEGEICLLVIVGTICGLYAAAKHHPRTNTKGRLARSALGLAGLALCAPLAAIYPHMLAPHSSVAPLPPSEEYDTILRAGYRILALQSTPAKRDKILAVLLELDQALPTPGHVTYDATDLARERLSTISTVDPRQALLYESRLEIARALHEGRDADVLRLARLLWRVGPSFQRGGTLDDYQHGVSYQSIANCSLAVLAPSMSDRECREMLHEMRALELALPDFQSVLDFDEYWRNASVGWRDRPQAFLRWLSGSNVDRSWNSSTYLDWHWLKRSPYHFTVVQYMLALELYRREHGHFPENLSIVQAAFDLPELTDPYTDFAPVYRQVEGGYLLYSIGFDGQDDGGKFPTESRPIRKPDNYDISLVFNRGDVSDQWIRHAQAFGIGSPAVAQPKPQPAAAK